MIKTLIYLLMALLFFDAVESKELKEEPKVIYLSVEETEPPRCSILAESYKEHKRESEKKKKRRNKKDVYLLAKLIYCEVGTIKKDECLYLCGSVVLNRVKDKRYPNTIKEVIYQRGQYEVTWNGAINSKKPDKRSIRIAKDLIKNGSINNKVMGMSETYYGTRYKQFNNVKFSIY